MANRRLDLAQSGFGSLDLCKLSIVLACVATVALRNWSFVVYAAQVFMVLMVLAKCARAGRVPNIWFYVATYGFFTCWCLTSVFWATDEGRVLSASVGIVQFVILGGCIAVYICVEQDTDFVIDCLAWASLALIAVLAATTPVTAWREAMDIMADASSASNRIGYSIGYHPNALGHLCAVSAAIWLYKYSKSGKKPINLLPVVLMCTIVVFTKSRLSVVIVVACIALYRILITKDFLRKFATLMVLLLAVLAVFWVLLNIPIFYQMVGFRFEAMLGLSGAVDASTSTRSDMIAIAMELFSSKPFTGVGFANYAVHYFYDYGGWTMTYAHSNYAELLADVGLPGTIAYYAVPVWTLCTLIKNWGKAANRELHVLLTTLALCLLVADYSSISYTNDFVQILWAASYAYALGLKRSQTRSVGDLNRTKFRGVDDIDFGMSLKGI